MVFSGEEIQLKSILVLLLSAFLLGQVSLTNALLSQSKDNNFASLRNKLHQDDRKTEQGKIKSDLILNSADGKPISATSPHGTNNGNILSTKLKQNTLDIVHNKQLITRRISAERRLDTRRTSEDRRVDARRASDERRFDTRRASDEGRLDARRASDERRLDTRRASEERRLDTRRASEKRRLDTRRTSDERRIDTRRTSDERRLDTRRASEEKRVDTRRASEERRLYTRRASDERRLDTRRGFDERRLDTRRTSDERRLDTRRASDERRLDTRRASDERRLDTRRTSDERRLDTRRASEERRLDTRRASEERRLDTRRASDERRLDTRRASEERRLDTRKTFEKRRLDTRRASEERRLNTRRASEERRLDTLKASTGRRLNTRTVPVEDPKTRTSFEKTRLSTHMLSDKIRFFRTRVSDKRHSSEFNNKYAPPTEYGIENYIYEIYLQFINMFKNMLSNSEDATEYISKSDYLNNHRLTPLNYKIESNEMPTLENNSSDTAFVITPTPFDSSNDYNLLSIEMMSNIKPLKNTLNVDFGMDQCGKSLIYSGIMAFGIYHQAPMKLASLVY